MGILGSYSSSTVEDYLEENGISFELIPHEFVRRSSDRAGVLGILAPELMKAILVKIGPTRSYRVAVLPAAEKLSMRCVARALAATDAQFCTEDEIISSYPWCALGSLPALPELLKVEGYFDHRSMARAMCVFPAGTAMKSVRIEVSDLIEKEGSVIEAALF